MEYKITIEVLNRTKDQNYPNKEEIYSQVVEDLWVRDLVSYINNVGDQLEK